MGHVLRHVCIAIALLGLASAATLRAAEAATTQPASPPTTRLSGERIGELIAKLSDPRWSARDQATAALKDAGLGVVDALAVAYKANAAPEVRLRIKAIVEHLVLMSLLEKPSGFLGVQQRLLRHIDDARIPEGRNGVMVVGILPHTAASAARITPGDIILAVNGKGLGADETQEGFAARIRDLAPGTTVGLTILRGRKELEIQATLKATPPEYILQMSTQFNTAQQRFVELWRSKFDPNDRHVTLSRPGQVRRPEPFEVRPEQIEIVPAPIEVGGDGE
ncbi:MAG: PDZ domain-containing protein [Phycisphaerae bacterium]|nr:PDZ domain-containing protein [Phycisphaerae bacterium]